MSHYFLKPGYVSREKSAEFLDDTGDVIWQPDVYTTAEKEARARGIGRVIDLGCGSARKLAAAFPIPEYAVTAFDNYWENIHIVQDRYPKIPVRFFDLEDDKPIPGRLEESLVIASDVIEHLVHPERMLAKMNGAASIVLSTPERELTHGAAHMGPPPNQAHVREWTLAEFCAFVTHALPDYHFSFRLTRSNDRENLMQTILATGIRSKKAGQLT